MVDPSRRADHRELRVEMDRASEVRISGVGQEEHVVHDEGEVAGVELDPDTFNVSTSPIKPHQPKGFTGPTTTSRRRPVSDGTCTSFCRPEAAS